MTKSLFDQIQTGAVRINLNTPTHALHLFLLPPLYVTPRSPTHPYLSTRKSKLPYAAGFSPWSLVRAIGIIITFPSRLLLLYPKPIIISLKNIQRPIRTFLPLTTPKLAMDGLLKDFLFLILATNWFYCSRLQTLFFFSFSHFIKQFTCIITTTKIQCYLQL